MHVTVNPDTPGFGRRVLVAHPIMCRQHRIAITPRHVHLIIPGEHPDVSVARYHTETPDPCAGCGRRWFAQDEITWQGFCVDCLAESILMLEIPGWAERLAMHGQGG